MHGLRQTASGLQEAVEDNLAHANKTNQQMEVAQINLDAFSDLISYANKYRLIGTEEINELSTKYNSLKNKYSAKIAQ